MPVIAWNESVPSNASFIRDTPEMLQSVTTSMAAALGTHALYWTPTSGSADSVGEMQPGGSRTYFAAASASSNADNATLGQRLFAASDTTRLYCYDSVGTYRVGTPYLVEAIPSTANASNELSLGAGPGLLQSGSTTYSVAVGTNLVTATFAQAYTRRPPSVAFSVGGSSIGVEWTVSLSTVTTGGVTFKLYPTPGYSPGNGPTVYWSSVGTVGGLV